MTTTRYDLTRESAALVTLMGALASDRERVGERLCVGATDAIADHVSLALPPPVATSMDVVAPVAPNGSRACLTPR